MAIRSSAFGRVVLTGEDASKFERQVRYGRQSSAAQESVRRGLDMLSEYERDGKVMFSIARPTIAKQGRSS